MSLIKMSADIQLMSATAVGELKRPMLQQLAKQIGGIKCNAKSELLIEHINKYFATISETESRNSISSSPSERVSQFITTITTPINISSNAAAHNIAEPVNHFTPSAKPSVIASAFSSLKNSVSSSFSRIFSRTPTPAVTHIPQPVLNEQQDLQPQVLHNESLEQTCLSQAAALRHQAALQLTLPGKSLTNQFQSKQALAQKMHEVVVIADIFEVPPSATHIMKRTPPKNISATPITNTISTTTSPTDPTRLPAVTMVSSLQPAISNSSLPSPYPIITPFVLQTLQSPAIAKYTARGLVSHRKQWHASVGVSAIQDDVVMLATEDGRAVSMTPRPSLAANTFYTPDQDADIPTPVATPVPVTNVGRQSFGATPFATPYNASSSSISTTTTPIVWSAAASNKRRRTWLSSNASPGHTTSVADVSIARDIGECSVVPEDVIDEDAKLSNDEDEEEQSRAMQTKLARLGGGGSIKHVRSSTTASVQSPAILSSSTAAVLARLAASQTVSTTANVGHVIPARTAGLPSAAISNRKSLSAVVSTNPRTTPSAARQITSGVRPSASLVKMNSRQSLSSVSSIAKKPYVIFTVDLTML